MCRWPIRRAQWLALLLTTSCVSWSEIVGAQPWTDREVVELPVRRAAGDTGLELAAEYRSQTVHLASYDLDGGNATWVEHRLRTHIGVDHDETVRIVIDVDALDGVLWGSGEGSALADATPSLGTIGVASRGPGASSDPSDYQLSIVEGDAATLRRAYGEVWTPVGLLRVGRQPTFEGSSLSYADGDGAANRFGTAGEGDQVDRVQLVTRPLSGFDSDSQRDDRGLNVTVHHDLLRQSGPRPGGDTTQRTGLGVRFLAPRPTLEQLYDAQLWGSVAYNPDTDTVIGRGSTLLTATVYELSVGFEAAMVRGQTRQSSLAWSPLTGSGDVLQTVNQFGARFVARWDTPVATAYLEVDYASGDNDPTADTQLRRFAFSRDANVGLLLFDHVLAHQSARSAAAARAAVENRSRPFEPVSNAGSLGEVAAQEVATRGAFTNAVAFFPQVDVRPTEELLFRGGVLLAWTPSGVVDPLASLRSRAAGGTDVNYRGGDPGFLYGTELDGRIEWQYREHFFANLEGAVLFPGDALHDENGDKETAGLVQGRLRFVF